MSKKNIAMVVSWAAGPIWVWGWYAGGWSGLGAVVSGYVLGLIVASLDPFPGWGG